MQEAGSLPPISNIPTPSPEAPTEEEIIEVDLDDTTTTKNTNIPVEYLYEKFLVVAIDFNTFKRSPENGLPT